VVHVFSSVFAKESISGQNVDSAGHRKSQIARRAYIEGTLMADLPDSAPISCASMATRVSDCERAATAQAGNRSLCPKTQHICG
jgi:hypothetical protein